MAKINRFSQIVNPTVVNPISFEEFNRVPMAKARAKAEGLSTVQGINTDYNVDAKDLEDVTAAVSIIDNNKNTLVDNIMSNGVTNNTISELLSLKKSRDKVYSNFVNKAQINKQKLDAWRQSVDKMYASTDPRYAETVKNKEYQKWEGTLQKDQTSGDTMYSDFVPSYGAKYYNLDKDVAGTLSLAGKDVSEEELKGSSFYWSNKLQQYVRQSPSGKIVTQNEDRLAKAANYLMREYTQDPNSDKFQFAQYAELDPNFILNKIGDYMNFMGSRAERSYGGETRYLGAGDRKQPDSDFLPYNIMGKSGLIDITRKVDLPQTETSWLGAAWHRIKQGMYRMHGQSKEADIDLIEYRKKISKDHYTMKKFVKENSEVIDYLSNPRVGVLRSDIKEKALQGDGEAITKAFQAVSDHYENLSEDEVSVGYYQGDYVNTSFGTKLKGKDRAKASKDLATFVNSAVVSNVKNRDDRLTPEKKAELALKLKTGEAQVIASLPTASYAATNSKGHDRELSQGYIIQEIDSDGKKIEEYVMGRTWEKTAGGQIQANYERNLAVESYIFKQPLGKSVPIHFTPDPSNPDRKYKTYYRQNPLNGRREVMLPNREGKIEPVAIDIVSGRLSVPEQVSQ